MAFYVILVVVGLLIGLSKGGLGAALVVLVAPLLSLVMSTSEAVSFSLPLLIFADILALYIYWKQWDMRYIRLMLPHAVIGVVIGTILLATLPDISLRRLLGVFTLVFVGYRVVSVRLMAVTYHPRNWHGYIAGAASGLGSALANTGSPPFTAYLLMQQVSPEVFAATTTLFFAVVNVLKLPAQAFAGLIHFERVLAALWILPVIVVGVGVGRWAVGRINQDVFEQILLFLLFVASMVLILVPPAH
jgi:uncharacterized membrane protein YfcA